MVIDSPNGFKETIEKTLDEYAMVAIGKLEPENFLSDPLEVIRLTNKLEIAHSEVRQSRQLLAYSEKYNSKNEQRIKSLEVQVSKLHYIIEQGLKSSNHAFDAIKKITELEKSAYYLNQAKFGGGFAAENGIQIGGNVTDLSNSNNLTDAAQKIIDILNQLQNQVDSEKDEIQKDTNDLAKQPIVTSSLNKNSQFQINIEVSPPVDSFNNQSKYKISGIIDTGASITLIPNKIVQALGLFPVGLAEVYIGIDGSKSINSYCVNIKIAEVDINQIIVYSWEKDFAIVGLDILRKFSILIDGYNENIKIFPV